MPADAAIPRPVASQTDEAAVYQPPQITVGESPSEIDHPSGKGLGRRYHVINGDGRVLCDPTRELDPQVSWFEVRDADRCRRCVRILLVHA
jgi:hypothetical protein